MTILVTGSAGFIGSHLIARLKELDIDYVGYDNLSNPFWIKPVDNLIIGDINDFELLESVFSNFQIDAVVHLAALIDNGESVKRPSKYFHVNVSGMFNVLSACVRHKVDKLILPSSFAVYGEYEAKVTENSAKKPKAAYGISKIMSEMALNRYSAAYGMKYTILRLANVAGRVVGGKDLISNCIKKNAILVNGKDYETTDGTAVRDYVHVQDVVEAIVLSLQDARTDFETYNVCSGKGRSILEVVNEVRKVKPLELEFTERLEGDIGFSVGDNKKLCELGWKPRKTFASIIKDAKKFHSTIINNTNTR